MYREAIFGNNRGRKFSFPMDNLAKFITLAGIAIAVLIVFSLKGYLFSYIGILLLPGLLLLILFFLLSPRYALLRDGELVVKMVLFKKRIPLSEIEEIKRIGRQELSKGVRLFASFGYFGYNGVVRLGGENAWVFSKKRGEMLFLRTNRGNYILGVERPQYLEEALKEGG